MNTLALVLFLALVHESVGKKYSISNAAQFMDFAKSVNGGKNYAKETVYLTDDIDLSAYSGSYTPVGVGYNVWFFGHIRRTGTCFL